MITIVIVVIIIITSNINTMYDAHNLHMTNLSTFYTNAYYCTINKCTKAQNLWEKWKWNLLVFRSLDFIGYGW